MSTNWSILLHSVSAQLVWLSMGSTLWNWRDLSHMPLIDLLNQLLELGPEKYPQTWILGMKSTKFFDRPICPENVCACNGSPAYCGVNQFRVASPRCIGTSRFQAIGWRSINFIYIEVLSPQIISLSGISQNEHHLKMWQEISHVFTACR